MAKVLKCAQQAQAAVQASAAQAPPVPCLAAAGCCLVLVRPTQTKACPKAITSKTIALCVQTTNMLLECGEKALATPTANIPNLPPLK